MAVQQQRVLADPAQPGLHRQSLLQHWRAVDEDPIVVCRDGAADPFRQLGEPLAHQLVVVASQRIARDVGPLRLLECLLQRHAGWQVVEPQRDHPQRARQQFGRATAAAAVLGHVGHVAMIAALQPVEQVLFIFRQFDAGDADGLKTEFNAPCLDPGGKLMVILRQVGRLHSL